MRLEGIAVSGPVQGVLQGLAAKSFPQIQTLSKSFCADLNASFK